MRKFLTMAVLALLVMACKKKSETVFPPDKVVMIFPSKDETCFQGEVLSVELSTVTFRWNPSSNTEHYEIVLKDLLLGTSTSVNSDEPQLAVRLKRNNPYSWTVISRSSRTSSTAQSEVWKFYNSGPGILSYAPFPVDVKFPALGTSVDAPDGKITLSWTGIDVDNDIAGYDVLFGEILPLTIVVAENLTEPALKDLKILSGKTYYWKVITKDARGNSSDSGIYQFKVN